MFTRLNNNTLVHEIDIHKGLQSVLYNATLSTIDFSTSRISSAPLGQIHEFFNGPFNQGGDFSPPLNFGNFGVLHAP